MMVPERRRSPGRRQHDDFAAQQAEFVRRLARVRRLLQVTLILCVSLFVLLAVAVAVTFYVLQHDRVARRNELAVAVRRSNALSACVLLDSARERQVNGDTNAANRLEDEARRFVGDDPFPPQCPPAPPRVPRAPTSTFPPGFPPHVP